MKAAPLVQEEKMKAAPLVQEKTRPELLEIPPELMPNYDEIVTEDETPVDNIFSERQQRLLTNALYDSWTGPGPGRPFLALANVGLFYLLHYPPLVPDVMLSLDISAPRGDMRDKRNRSYFVWEYGKPPDVVIEIVSNLEGEEKGEKLRQYAWIGVPYYVVFDPLEILRQEVLHIYALREKVYVELEERWLPSVGLGLTLWQGTFQGMEGTWLRWTDKDGHLLLTGAERAEQERQRAEQERQRAEQERQRAERAERELERLAARLRELGIEPFPTDS